MLGCADLRVEGRFHTSDTRTGEVDAALRLISFRRAVMLAAASEEVWALEVTHF